MAFSVTSTLSLLTCWRSSKFLTMSSFPGPPPRRLCYKHWTRFAPGLERGYTALHNKVKENIALRKLVQIQGFGLTICKPRSPNVVIHTNAATLQNGHDGSLPTARDVSVIRGGEKCACCVGGLLAIAACVGVP